MHGLMSIISSGVFAVCVHKSTAHWEPARWLDIANSRYMEHVTSLIELQLPSRLCNDSSRAFSRFLTEPVRKLRYATHLGTRADFGQGRDHSKAERSSNYTLSTQVCQVKET